MLFPCRNDGCDELLPYEKLARHESECSRPNVSGGENEASRRLAIHTNLLNHVEQHIAPFFVTRNNVSHLPVKSP